jgi:hypothetical protein
MVFQLRVPKHQKAAYSKSVSKDQELQGTEVPQGHRVPEWPNYPRSGGIGVSGAAVYRSAGGPGAAVYRSAGGPGAAVYRSAGGPGAAVYRSAGGPGAAVYRSAGGPGAAGKLWSQRISGAEE